MTTAPSPAQRDLTHARVLKIALPIVAANVTVPLLGLADTAVVGQMGLAAPIGAVGLGAVILSSVYWIFGFLRMGTTGLAAQAQGSGDTEETGAIIDIRDDGTIVIASSNQVAADAARKRIEQITADVEPGRVYEGKVVKLMDFGAFVTILPGRDGLVHVSQISNERVENVSDKLKEGDVVRVKVLEVDKQGRIRLSMKALEEEAKADS